MRSRHLSKLFAVLAALTLATGASARTPLPPPPAEVAVDPVSSPDWEADMARFAAEDTVTPPPPHPVVFTGSSSVRRWTTLARDFPQVAVLNRGFGGSQVRDAVHYADQIAVRYRPRAIVIYAGDNDIAAGRTPQQVLGDLRAFVSRIRRDLPATPIVYISIKPSPSREQQLDAQRTANALVKNAILKLACVDYIDVFTPMLDAKGRPRPELFGADRLHMNDAGYALWRGIVAQHLRRFASMR